MEFGGGEQQVCAVEGVHEIWRKSGALLEYILCLRQYLYFCTSKASKLSDKLGSTCLLFAMASSSPDADMRTNCKTVRTTFVDSFLYGCIK